MSDRARDDDLTTPAGLDLLEAYRAMYRVRAVEEALVAAWHDGVLPGEMHSAIGEEAAYAGVLAHLGDGDTLSVTHRSTPAFVMRGTDLDGLFLDCLGSPEGPGRGMNGHMHLFDPERRITSDGIVGSSAAYGIGQALALQLRSPGRLAVAFHGEGATNQGMLLESYSLAVAWRLPILFVALDNGWSITTHSADVTGGTVAGRARGFGLTVAEVDGDEPDRVYAAAFPLVRGARKGRPGLLHVGVHRPSGHFEGDPLGRVLRTPIAQVRAPGPGLAKGFGDRHAGPLGERGRGARELTSRVLAVGRTTLRSAHPDPVRALRGRLAGQHGAALAAIEAEVGAEVAAAAAGARGAVAGRTTAGRVVFGVQGGGR